LRWNPGRPDPGGSRAGAGREEWNRIPRERSGGGKVREGYRVLAAADGLVDVEVVHGGGVVEAGGGGAPLSPPVRFD